MARLPAILRSLTPTSAKAAFFIDFEGLGRRPGEKSPRPSFLGVLQPTAYSGIIFDKRLSLLAKGKAGFPGMRNLNEDLDEVLQGLIEKAEQEGAWILYFSQHEEKLVDEYCSEEVRKAFRARSANAKLLIQKWAKTKPVKVPKECSLDEFCHLAGIASPVPPGRGLAESIIRLTKACGKTRKWSNLSDAHKDLARTLFIYNRDDCKALKKLTIKAANYFESKR